LKKIEVILVEFVQSVAIGYEKYYYEIHALCRIFLVFPLKYLHPNHSKLQGGRNQSSLSISEASSLYL